MHLAFLFIRKETLKREDTKEPNTIKTLMKASELSSKWACFYQVVRIQKKVTGKVRHSGRYGSAILQVPSFFRKHGQINDRL